jgi:hypothetical protein
VLGLSRHWGLITAAAVLLAPLPARADGNSLIGYPQSNVTARNAFHFDWDTVGIKAGTNVFSAAGVTFGLGSGLRGGKDKSDKDGILGRTEIGVDYLLTAGDVVPTFASAHDRFFFNFKTQLYNNDKAGTRVVVGGYNIGVNELGTSRDLYVLTSKEDRRLGKLQFGLAHAFGEEFGLKTPAGNADRTYLQLSYNRHVWQRLYGAYAGYTGLSAQSRQSVALAYYLDNTYKGSFAIGYLRYNDDSVRPGRDQIYFGFDYDWGGPKAK